MSKTQQQLETEARDLAVTANGLSALLTLIMLAGLICVGLRISGVIALSWWLIAGMVSLPILLDLMVRRYVHAKLFDLAREAREVDS